MSKKPSQSTMEETLRKALAARPESIRAIARGAGVSHPVIVHFLSGKRGLRLDVAAKLADFLGLELRPRDGARK